MKVIKRNGEEVPFDAEKIINTISAANREVEPIYQLNEYQIRAVEENVSGRLKETPAKLVILNFTK